MLNKIYNGRTNRGYAFGEAFIDKLQCHSSVHLEYQVVQKPNESFFAFSRSKMGISASFFASSGSKLQTRIVTSFERKVEFELLLNECITEVTEKSDRKGKVVLPA